MPTWMTTDSPSSPEGNQAGTYLIFPHSRSFSMVPGLGLSEHFQFSVSPGESVIRVVHDEYWLGLRAFTMRYRIRRKVK